MKPSILIVILFFVIIKLTVCQQSSEHESRVSLFSKYEQAQLFLDDENYAAAIPLYKELLANNVDNSNYCFKLGYCYLNTFSDNKLAIDYLERAVINVSKNFKESYTEKFAPLEALFYLGKAYHIAYRFDEAVNTFNKLLSYDNLNDTVFIKNVRHNIEYANNAKELIKKPVNITVENLGDSVNSKFAEHSPVFSADESVLIFTSKREGSTGGMLTANGEFYEDIYISYKNNGKWSSPKGISNAINTNGHEASIGLSIDAQKLLIYKDDDGDGNIYVSTLTGDEWSVPEKLGNTVNTKYRESHASLSADGMLMYFASNRPGGYGGMDIYVVRLLPNGEFSEAQNMGPRINTEYDEEGPFIHPDGVTLFFSSQSHNSMGGFDIFYSTIDEENKTCSVPVNLGYPINTTGDDVFYNPTPDGNRAYYASYREGGKGQNDLYLLTLTDEKEKSLAVLTGLFTVNDVPSADASITVTDFETQETVGSYVTNAKTGKYIFVLPSGRKYSIEYDGGNGLVKNIDLMVSSDSSYSKIQQALKLKPVNLGFHIASIVLKGNVYDETTHQPLKSAIEVFDVNKNQKIAEINTDSEKGYFETTLSAGKNYGINVNSENYLFYSENIDVTQLKDDKEINKEILLKKVEIASKIILKNIFFDFNKSTLRKESTIELNSLINLLQNQFPTMKIEISGHTDNKGSLNFNMNLSTNRAKAVVDYLVKAGVSSDRLTYKGYAFQEPIASNDTNEGRQMNRRVEFKIISK